MNTTGTRMNLAPHEERARTAASDATTISARVARDNRPRGLRPAPQGGNDVAARGRLIALLAAGLALAGVLIAAPIDSAAAAGKCGGLIPSSSAAANRQAIQACLDSPTHKAVLTRGTFAVDDMITVPSAGILLGDISYPTIRLHTNANARTRLIDMPGTSARVGFLTIDSNALLGHTCCSATITVEGSNNLIDDDIITGAYVRFGTVKTDFEPAGVYIIGDQSSGNRLLRNQITRNFHGVMFSKMLDAAHPNSIEQSSLNDNQCDGVNFAGYGELYSSELRRNGHMCFNDPTFGADGIPGAAIYSGQNMKGARIVGNIMSDSCGANFDLDTVANFWIENNSAEAPGNKFDKYGVCHPWCLGASFWAANVRDSTIKGNTFKNEGRSSNRLRFAAYGDPNGYFGTSAVYIDPPPLDGTCGVSGGTEAAEFSDLPAGGDTVIAAVLAEREGDLSNPQAGTTTHNVFDNNAFIANCQPPCLGLGLFVSRDTGYDSAGGWSAATTNYFTSNRTFGSNYGSKRGGGNWYAAYDVCPQPPAQQGVGCNDDDYQHNPPAGDWARNDGFYRR